MYFRIINRSGKEIQEDDMPCDIFYHQDGTTEIRIQHEDELAKIIDKFGPVLISNDASKYTFVMEINDIDIPHSTIHYHDGTVMIRVERNVTTIKDIIKKWGPVSIQVKKDHYIIKTKDKDNG